MRRARRRSALAVAAVAAAALAFPALASAHAVLLRTSPVASGTVNTPPSEVALTYSEPVEPRFAIVSVTDAAGKQQTSGPPQRSATNPNQLVVPLQHVGEGWYLVYWRVISVDGHPVQGAFTFAVGPNPGPAPQFVIPSLGESAATPRLLTTRWATFLSVMAAIGLFVLRMLTARPLLRRVAGTSLDPLSVLFGIATVVALIATPIYVEVSTAEFARRSFFDLANVVPLVRDSAFGRAYTDLELILALFAIAAFVAILIDRPDRPQRSVAELLALDGALVAAAAALLTISLAGHAAQTSPRGLALTLDWVHLAGGSLWIGGLAGLLLVWITLGTDLRLPGLQVVVPRFSRVALGSVLIVIGTGIWASFLHLPTVASLWQTSYGKALIVKVLILLGALLLGGANNQRTVPRLAIADTSPVPAEGAASLLRSLVTLEIVLVAAVIFAAGVLSSFAPPSKALASIGKSSVRVGPGPVTQVVTRQGYRLEFHVSPNRAAVPNAFTVKITKNGVPLQNADVTTTFTMLDMEMGQQGYRLQEVSPGVYSQSKPALVMVGHWGLTFEIAPPGKQPLTVQFVDRANG